MMGRGFFSYLLFAICSLLFAGGQELIVICHLSTVSGQLVAVSDCLSTVDVSGHLPAVNCQLSVVEGRET
jgi:hypothetical protein